MALKYSRTSDVDKAFEAVEGVLKGLFDAADSAGILPRAAAGVAAVHKAVESLSPADALRVLRPLELAVKAMQVSARERARWDSCMATWADLRIRGVGVQVRLKQGFVVHSILPRVDMAYEVRSFVEGRKHTGLWLSLPVQVQSKYWIPFWRVADLERHDPAKDAAVLKGREGTQAGSRVIREVLGGGR